MRRMWLGICGALLFGAFAGLSGVAQAHDEPNASDVVLRQDMSDEEKERRREVCNTEFEFCWDWCGKSNPKDASARGKCREDCKKKLAECMKKIPSNPTEDPDY